LSNVLQNWHSSFRLWISFQSRDIIKHWNAGDITTAEMEKAFGRSITGNGLNIGGILLCGSAISGTVGLVVGAGLAIAVGVGDRFY
jgi:hypothetical protein